MVSNLGRLGQALQLVEFGSIDRHAGRSVLAPIGRQALLLLVAIEFDGDFFQSLPGLRSVAGSHLPEQLCQFLLVVTGGDGSVGEVCEEGRKRHLIETLPDQQLTSLARRDLRHESGGNGRAASVANGVVFGIHG